MKRIEAALLVIVLIFVGAFAAWHLWLKDGVDDVSDPNHVHEYSWQGDSDYHWQEATCHSIKKEKESHNYNSDFVCTECMLSFPDRQISSTIVHSLMISPYNSEIVMKNNDGEILLNVGANAIKATQNGQEVYYKFVNGVEEIYTINNDKWQCDTMYDYADVYSCISNIYPILNMVTDAGGEVVDNFTFDPVERRLNFEHPGELPISKFVDFKGSIEYNAEYAWISVECSFSFNSEQYELKIKPFTDIIEFPVVPSAGVTVDLALDGTYVIMDMGSCTDVNVVIPSEIDGIPVTSIAPEAFKDNKIIQSVTVPGSVKIIGESAFEGCTSLQTVVLQDGVEEIGDKAFYMSDSRAYLEFTDSIKKIGADAFDDSVAYFDKGVWNFIGDINKYVEIEFENIGSSPSENRFMHLNGEEFSEVTIDTATRINDFAFANADTIENYYIGKQVTYFGENSITSSMWYRDENQEMHYIPHNLYYEGTIDEFLQIEKNGLWTLGEWKLYCNNELVDTIVLEGMESIPLGMFYQCVGLKHLVIKEGVKIVERYAFYGIDFETVELPASLTTFEYWAFSYASIPDGKGIFTMVEYYEGEIYHLAIYMRVGDNPYYLLVERSYTNVEINENTKYRQAQQWECPEWEDWFEEPRPTT